MPTLDILKERLEKLKAHHRYRTLANGEGIDLLSNDYLGFSGDEELKENILNQLAHFPVGATGSRLLSGHSDLATRVEKKLALFVGQSEGLVFPSGMQANMALLSALLQAGDVVFSDEYNHASLIDGMRLSKAKKVIFKHNDLSDLQKALEAHKSAGGVKIIVTESLFSMEGDCAPLAQICGLGEEYGASLIVDESHATGLFGEGGGRCQELNLSSQVLACVHTGGKALGVGGAWVATSKIVKDYLVNMARGFIFSTAPIPALFVSLSCAVDHWQKHGANRAQILLSKSRHLRDKLRQNRRGYKVIGERGPISSLIIGDNQKALSLALKMRSKGLSVRAIRPPTVPEGSARIRLACTYPVMWEYGEQVCSHLFEAMEEF